MTALDEILATIRRLPLPERLRLIERAKLEVDEDTPKPGAVAERERKPSVDEFLARRLTPPPGVGPVSLQDMDRAIAEGAIRRGSAGDLDRLQDLLVKEARRIPDSVSPLGPLSSVMRAGAEALAWAPHVDASPERVPAAAQPKQETARTQGRPNGLTKKPAPVTRTYY